MACGGWNASLGNRNSPWRRVPCIISGTTPAAATSYSFLALRLEVDLQRRLDKRGAEGSRPGLMRDLKQCSR